MDTETFFAGVTSVTVLDADETPTVASDTLLFSYGDNLGKIQVSVTPRVMDDFLTLENGTRAQIMNDVFRLYSTSSPTEILN